MCVCVFGFLVRYCDRVRMLLWHFHSKRERERERESVCVCVCDHTVIQGICDVFDVTVNVLSSQTLTMTPILPRSYIS